MLNLSDSGDLSALLTSDFYTVQEQRWSAVLRFTASSAARKCAPTPRRLLPRNLARAWRAAEKVTSEFSWFDRSLLRRALERHCLEECGGGGDGGGGV